MSVIRFGYLVKGDVPDFECEEKEECFDAVESTIDEITLCYRIDKLVLILVMMRIVVGFQEVQCHYN